jgi:Protein of unknown function (DUF2637)
VNAELTGRPPAPVPPRPASTGRSAGTDVRPADSSRAAGTPGRPATAAEVAGGRHLAVRSPVSGTDGSRVATLDRLTLHLGVVVAAVIALCSYAVSATSLYALGRQAGYAPWQAVAVPVVADGPAIYGMVRIVSRARRGANGAGYGWLLVGAGTLASIGGNVAHARPELVARLIAAAIPLAVLAMLEALKGDAQEVAGLAAAAAGPSGPSAAAAGNGTADTNGGRRNDPPATDNQADTPAVRKLTAGPRPADIGVRQRLAAAYTSGRGDGRPWTARSLADAAGCGRTAAARFLQAQRQAGGEASS